MSTFQVKDGTMIAYKDWGSGRPILFSHGWPLSGDAWAPQMLYFGSRGYRVIAHDRRGHGRSGQTWDGNTMEQFADDLAELIEALDLRDVILVGHSMAGGEVCRYVSRHGTGRIGRIVLAGAVPPLMLKTPANPEGVPMEVFDGIRQGLAGDRSQFFKDLSMSFYGFNKPGAKVSEGRRETFWSLGMMGGIKPEYDCVREFSEVDFTEDLKKFDKPTLFIHGDADQIVPIATSALKAAKIVKGAELKVYPGAGHGLTETEADKFNADLLAFIKA
ncbi:MAG: prolyl oligopeptidase family protein [Devosia sp.]|uniref:alpha/beta fold hydrolase n=1 Tax=Devosia sp. TaxID=1871048 RepID=UPI00262BE8EF|nr:alpha/beta hydrolase [Devosia sp.]MDB5539739.1 prolyl oligopeptidase family protein [Devosia sp.]